MAAPDAANVDAVSPHLSLSLPPAPTPSGHLFFYVSLSLRCISFGVRPATTIVIATAALSPFPHALYVSEPFQIAQFTLFFFLSLLLTSHLVFLSRSSIFVFICLGARPSLIRGIGSARSRRRRREQREFFLSPVSFVGSAGVGYY